MDWCKGELDGQTALHSRWFVKDTRAYEPLKRHLVSPGVQNNKQFLSTHKIVMETKIAQSENYGFTSKWMSTANKLNQRPR